jgi:predicted RNase H-like HicB family nuclease
MNNTHITKDLAYYLALPYTIVLRKDEDGDVIARIEELRGCISHGKDEVEALKDLATLKKMWIEDSLEAGEQIPEPEESELPSGKWVQRVPRRLHLQLVRMAKSEEVSLNQLVTSMLSEQLGARSMMKAVEKMMAEYMVSSESAHPRDYWGLSSKSFTLDDWHLDRPSTANASHFLTMARRNPTIIEGEENVEDSKDHLYFVQG